MLLNINTKLSPPNDGSCCRW